MRQYNDGSVEAEDARDAVTNRAADASAESGKAGAADVSAVGAPGEEPAAPRLLTTPQPRTRLPRTARPTGL